jgi:hypothetical protein
MSFLDKITSSRKKMGFFDTSIYVLHKALQKENDRKIRLYKYYFIVQPILNNNTLKSKQSAFIIREIFSDDPCVKYFPRLPEIIRGRFDQGANCLAAFKNGEFVGFIWLILGSYEEDEVRCRFTPFPESKTSWDFDVYVEPKYRISTAFVRLWDAANGFLQERGISWTMSRISAFNFTSRAIHTKMGGQVVGSAYFMIIGRFQLMFATMPPYFHFSQGPFSSPEIILKPKS